MQTNTIITNAASFTTPTGVHFPKGSEFVVNMVGSRNARCHSKIGGAVVWFDITEGVFVAKR